MLFGEGPQIKNIAADLNKLFRQGSLLNQIGQTVEGDSFLYCLRHDRKLP